MRKVISIIALCLTIFLVGCSNNKVEQHDDSKKTVVVTTSFLNDMVKELVGDKVNVKMIIPAGEDPHMYVAKPNDLTKIQSADLLLYHGLHFEGKLSAILEKKGKSVTENFKESDVSTMDEDGIKMIDPHFWFDINLYKMATYQASKYLIDLLPEDKLLIEKNTEVYKHKLDELDKENRILLSQIPKGRRYLVTPHDAFNYFSRMYDIEVVAPQGVSTDSEVANNDIEKTADFIVSHNIKAIFSESTTNPDKMRKLQEIVKSKGFNVTVVSGEGNELYSDSLAPDGDEDSSYVNMYRHNVKLIYDNLK